MCESHIFPHLNMQKCVQMHIFAHFPTFLHIAEWARSEIESIFRCYSPEMMKARWEQTAQSMDAQGCSEYRKWLQDYHMNEEWRLWCYCASGVEGHVANTNMIESFHNVIKNSRFIDLNRETTAKFHYISMDQLCRCVCVINVGSCAQLCLWHSFA